jgi:hypothetical protein
MKAVSPTLSIPLTGIIAVILGLISLLPFHIGQRLVDVLGIAQVSGTYGHAEAQTVDESDVIRIGIPGVHADTFIAGIASTHLTGSQVVVTSGGQPGVVASSERYKTATISMDSDAMKLQQLRPVTFHLKTEPTGALQFGLIAEEVVKVYPELVIRNESGQIEGLRYDELAPILLREVQQQQKMLADQAGQLRDLKQQFAQMAETNRQMQAVLLALQGKASQVASR